jgi:hypothetical protein
MDNVQNCDSYISDIISLVIYYCHKMLHLFIISENELYNIRQFELHDNINVLKLVNEFLFAFQCLTLSTELHGRTLQNIVMPVIRADSLQNFVAAP